MSIGEPLDQAVGVVPQQYNSPDHKEHASMGTGAIVAEELTHHPGDVSTDPQADSDVVDAVSNVLAAVPSDLDRQYQRGGDDPNPDPVPVVAPGHVLQQPQRHVGVLDPTDVLIGDPQHLHRFHFKGSMSTKPHCRRLGPVMTRDQFTSRPVTTLWTNSAGRYNTLPGPRQRHSFCVRSR